MRELEASLNLLALIRSAQSKPGDYKAVVREFRNKITEIRVGKGLTVQDNWKSLKKKGRK